MKTGRRAAGEPADVVRDLHEAHGDGVEGTRRAHHRVASPLGLEVIVRFAERHTRPGRDAGDRSGGELGVGVDPRAHRGPAERQLLELRGRRSRPLDPLPHLHRIPAELLPQPHGGRVHQVRATGFDDPVERRRLRLEGRGECIEGGEQVPFDRHARRHVDRGRDRVVGGLSEVHVVVGVHARLSAQELGGPRRHDLVGVHVGGRSRAGLIHVDRELRVPTSVSDLAGGLLDRVCQRRLEVPERGVRLRGGLLDPAHGLDEATAESSARDGEVLDGPLGLCTVERVRGHRHLSQGIPLGAGLTRHGSSLPDWR